MLWKKKTLCLSPAHYYKNFSEWGSFTQTYIEDTRVVSTGGAEERWRSQGSKEAEQENINHSPKRKDTEEVSHDVRIKLFYLNLKG